MWMTTMYDEDLEDLKQSIRGMVVLFKAIWDEVAHQFSKLSRSERIRIFGIIAPNLTDVMVSIAGMGVDEDLKERQGRK